jgi:REP element-mobilizing transposase RayT
MGLPPGYSGAVMKESATNRPSLFLSTPLPSKQSGRVITTVSSPEPHQGWHSRGYLPHWDHPGMVQSINVRLCDSLPWSVLERWENEIERLPAKSQAKRAELRRRIEVYLDEGHGACWLRHAEIARLVEGALLFFDQERYRLLAWCVMPNHVHVLIETMIGFLLGEVVHSWKSYTASRANKVLGRSGKFWQNDYLDRYIRNAEHFTTVVGYIEENPVKAGLARLKTEWPWSSARFRAEPGGAGILPASPERSKGQNE